MTQSNLPVDMMMFNCEKHGTFQCAPLYFFGKAKPLSRCPTCTVEYIAQQAAREAQLETVRARAKQAAVVREPPESIPVRYRQATLGNYAVTNDGQAKAVKRLEWFVKTFTERQQAGTSLLLIGNPGTGKTHLGCAIVTALDLLFYRTQYSTVADFSAAIRECYKDGAKHTEKQVMQRYTKPDLLVLDEVGASSGSDHEKQILFEVMNERYNNVLPTVLISNLTQADITAYLGERIMDRMREGGGKLLRLDWESYRK